MKNFKICFTLFLIIVLLAGCGLNSEKSNSSKLVKHSDNKIQVFYIDVGKGDCILIKTLTHTVMIDTGFAETYNKVKDFLNSKDIVTIDKLIITHYDKDHVGGAASLVCDFNVKDILLPNYKGVSEEYKTFSSIVSEREYSNVTKNTTFELDSVKFFVFASSIKYKKSKGNDNDVSITIGVNNFNDSYFFAGDIEKEGIKSLIQKNIGQYDVLKLPHHGVKNSKSDDLFENMLPKITIITDSMDERSDKKIRKIIKKYNSDMYCSSYYGNIEIDSSGYGKYNVITENK